MTKEQNRLIELIKNLHLKYEDMDTNREKEFFYALLVMKHNYALYMQHKYLTGGRKKFANSLNWFFDKYKDEIADKSDYFVLDEDLPIIATYIETSEDVYCKNTEDACKVGSCCKKSLTDILAGRKETCKGWTYRYAD